MDGGCYDCLTYLCLPNVLYVCLLFIIYLNLLAFSCSVVCLKLFFVYYEFTEKIENNLLLIILQDLAPYSFHTHCIFVSKNARCPTFLSFCVSTPKSYITFILALKQYISCLFMNCVLPLKGQKST